jgi:hypothetical protein
MLDRRGDDVLTLAMESKERALDSQIVGFAAAAREHDLLGR